MKFVKTLIAIPMAALALSAASSFPNPAADATPAASKGTETAVFAGGCFWGVEAVFEHVKGVSDVVSGYAGGNKSTANYETVSTGRTGHAESVRITYDPSQVTYGQLLKVFFSVAHDPTELNRQGPDTGTQYRSNIFYMNPEQKRIAEAYIQQLDEAKIYPSPIVTKVTQLDKFYPAEEHHQNFIQRNPNYPYVVINDIPKIKQLKVQFPEMYKGK